MADCALSLSAATNPSPDQHQPFTMPGNSRWQIRHNKHRAHSDASAGDAPARPPLALLDGYWRKTGLLSQHLLCGSNRYKELSVSPFRIALTRCFLRSIRLGAYARAVSSVGIRTND